MFDIVVSVHIIKAQHHTKEKTTMQSVCVNVLL